MRTIIQLSKEALEKLALICQREKISRAEAIRRAVSQFARQYEKNQKGEDSAFGLWKGRSLDSVTYENEIRKEWEKK